MLSLPDEKNFRFLVYWLGGFLRETGWGVNFPQLSELGPVSFTMSSKFPIHQYMLDTLLEAIGRSEINGNNLKTVTTKEMYLARMENFQELVYPRIKHALLEVKQRDLLFSLIHNIYPN